MTPTSDRTAPGSAGLTVVLSATAVLLLAGCTVGGTGEEPTGATGQTSGQTSEPTAAAAAGALEVDVDLGAPSGWRSWQVGGLVFAAPPEFDVAGAPVRGATATLVPPTTEDGELLGAIEVYAEDAQLGPLDVRTQLTQDVRSDQLGSPPVEPARALDVPGSEGGSLLLWEYEQVVEPTGRTVPSVIAELDVLMAEGPQYSASVSGASEVLSLDDIEALVASARVVDVAGG